MEEIELTPMNIFKAVVVGLCIFLVVVSIPMPEIKRDYHSDINITDIIKDWPRDKELPYVAVQEKD